MWIDHLVTKWRFAIGVIRPVDHVFYFLWGKNYPIDCLPATVFSHDTLAAPLYLLYVYLPKVVLWERVETMIKFFFFLSGFFFSLFFAIFSLPVLTGSAGFIVDNSPRGKGH